MPGNIHILPVSLLHPINDPSLNFSYFQIHKINRPNTERQEIVKTGWMCISGPF